MWPVPIVFLATLCLSLVLDVVGRRSSPAKDAVDPRLLASPLSGLLGWGVVAAGVAALWWYVPGTRAEEGPLLRVAGLLAGSWVIGSACDRFPIPREVRIGLVLLLSIAASVFVTSFDVVKAPFSARFIPLGLMSQPLTALWIFIVAYAFFGTNLIPGLALGLSGVISTTLLAIGLLQPQATGALAMMLTAPLAGFSLGQWKASRSPDARRMDSGTALSLGFALALITVAGALKNTAFLVLILPMLVLGTPLIDVTYAILRKPKGETLEGEAVTLKRTRLRLHDVLLQEAVPLRKVTSLLIALDGYLCLLALLLVLMIRVHFAFKLLLMLPALVVGGVFFYSLSKLFARKAATLPGDKINLLNVAISPLSMSETMERVEEYIVSRQPHMIVTSDTSLIVKAQDDPEFFRIVNEADMVTADGIGVVLSARLLSLPVFERVSGVDMVAGMCDLAAKKGYRPYFLGAAPGVAEQAAQKLTESYPGLAVAGTHHGYFKPEEEDRIVETISGSRADILFVALGIPRQEKFIRQYKDRMQVPVCIGVGGSLDVYAGVVARAPVWMQRCGLEWLYRTAKQPKRLGRLAYIPRLLFLTYRHLLRGSEGKIDG